MREQLADWLEDLRVRWLLMDAQQKQLLLLGAFYVMLSALDVATELTKRRIR